MHSYPQSSLVCFYRETVERQSQAQTTMVGFVLEGRKQFACRMVKDDWVQARE